MLEALRLGQAMASLNCQFEGARGGMYVLQKEEFVTSVRAILRSKLVNCQAFESLPNGAKDLFRCLCPSCRETNTSSFLQVSHLSC